jgi:hypothetical protein
MERSRGVFLSRASPVQLRKSGAVGVLHDVGRRGRIPGGVAAGFEGGAEAAGGEAGGVGLTLDELLAGEFGDRAAVAVGGEEAVVLLGGDAGHGLEKVRVVGGAFLEGPVLHGAGDGIGDGGVELFAELDGALKGLVDALGETGALDFFVEDVGPEEIFDMRLFEIDAVEIVLGTGNRPDRLLAHVGHWLLLLRTE